MCGITLCGVLSRQAQADESYAAKIGDTEYATLDAALAAVTADSPLTEVTEAAWPAATPVYYGGTFYKAENGNGALENAILAANAANSSESAKIYIRPNTVGTLSGDTFLATHQHHTLISTSIVIYGNNAQLNTSWEPCVEHDTSASWTPVTMPKSFSVEMYNLNNGAGVWGIRTSDYTLDVTMKNCSNVHEFMINSAAGTPNSTTNYTIENCSFDGTGYASTCPVTTTNAGTVVVKNCTFANVNSDYPLNINNKNGGKTVVEVSDCTFTNCGKDGKEIIRLTGEVTGATVEATLTDLTFDATSQENAIIVGNTKPGSNKSIVTFSITGTTGKLTIYDVGNGTAIAGKASISATEDTVVGDNDTYSQDSGAGLWSLDYDTADAGVTVTGTTATFNTDASLTTSSLQIPVLTYVKATTGTTIVLPEEGSKAGYTFLGWTDYANAASGTILTSVDDGGDVPADQIYAAKSVYAIARDATIRPVWRQDKYTVTYTDGADGSAFADQATEGLMYGDETPEFDGTPTRDGYVFAGWSPEVADSVTGDVTYTAVWERLYTVTYSDGVDGSVFADQVTDGLVYGEETPAFDGTPTRKGYVFKGWSPEVADTVTEDVTYVAQWQKAAGTTTKTTTTKTPALPNTGDPALAASVIAAAGAALAGLGVGLRRRNRR